MKRVTLLLAVVAALTMALGGLAAAKAISGTTGDDRLVGTNQKDTISGAGGDDTILGKGRRDRLYGDSGNDKIRGGGGNDQLFTGSGDDRLKGNTGNDFLNAADETENDIVNCGQGDDDAVVDTGDRVTDCEEVFVVASDTPQPSAASSQDASTLGSAGLDEALANGTLEPATVNEEGVVQ